MADTELVRLTLEGWHPACWTLDATAGQNGGLLGHGITTTVGRGVGLYTAYGDSISTIDALLEAIDGSPRTEGVTSFPGSLAVGGVRPDVCQRNVIVEFDPGNGIRDALSNRGLLHYGPSRHEDGRERRTLLGWGDRRTVLDRLEYVADENGVDFDLLSVATTEMGAGDGRSPIDRLTRRQLDAFRIARDRGYYAYPRGVTARELASELDISKTTFLEHLRKAEAKLLMPYQLD